MSEKTQVRDPKAYAAIGNFLFKTNLSPDSIEATCREVVNNFQNGKSRVEKRVNAVNWIKDLDSAVGEAMKEINQSNGDKDVLERNRKKILFDIGWVYQGTFYEEDVKNRKTAMSYPCLSYSITVVKESFGLAYMSTYGIMNNAPISNGREDCRSFKLTSTLDDAIEFIRHQLEVYGKTAFYRVLLSEEIRNYVAGKREYRKNYEPTFRERKKITDEKGPDKRKIVKAMLTEEKVERKLNKIYDVTDITTLPYTIKYFLLPFAKDNLNQEREAERQRQQAEKLRDSRRIVIDDSDYSDSIYDDIYDIGEDNHHEDESISRILNSPAYNEEVESEKDPIAKQRNLKRRTAPEKSHATVEETESSREKNDVVQENEDSRDKKRKSPIRIRGLKKKEVINTPSVAPTTPSSDHTGAKVVAPEINLPEAKGEGALFSSNSDIIDVDKSLEKKERKPAVIHNEEEKKEQSKDSEDAAQPKKKKGAALMGINTDFSKDRNEKDSDSSEANEKSEEKTEKEDLPEEAVVNNDEKSAVSSSEAPEDNSDTEGSADSEKHTQEPTEDESDNSGQGSVGDNKIESEKTQTETESSSTDNEDEQDSEMNLLGESKSVDEKTEDSAENENDRSEEKEEENSDRSGVSKEEKSTIDLVNSLYEKETMGSDGSIGSLKGKDRRTFLDSAIDDLISMEDD